MPGPVIGVYVVAAIGTVAAGYAFKQFVYDPYISPKVHKWVEEMKARQGARRNRVRRKATTTPHGSFMHEDSGRRSADGDDVGSLVELESLRGSSTSIRGSGHGGESLLVSGLVRSNTAGTTRRRARAPEGGTIETSESTERLPYPVMAPTPSYTTMSPPTLARYSPSPQPSLSDSADFSLGSSTIASASASIETLSVRSPSVAASPRPAVTSPPLQAAQVSSPRSPRSPASFNSLDSPQVQLPTPISAPRSPSQLFSSLLTSPEPTPGLGLTTGPAPAPAPALHAPAMSADSRSFSSLSFNTALSELQDGSDRDPFHTSASSSQVFIDARSEASFSPDDDMIFSFHSASQRGSTTGDVRSPSVGGSTHIDDDLDFLSDSFSDEGGSHSSWEEVAAQRDGALSPRRHV